MNENIISNYAKLKSSLFYLPLFLLISIVVFLYIQNALNVEAYTQIQKNYFFFFNSKLSQLPSIQYNLTQLGDVLIIFSLLSIFIIYAPKMWESLISASLVSALLSGLLKALFAVPRPAETLDNKSFVIIGKACSGYSSLPSGHSITVFTTLTILLFGFMPKELKFKILWCFLAIITGLIIVSTRVGVGAHYPLDVIVGSIIGYISGLIGIFINQKYSIWTWIGNRKYYPVFIVLFLVCCCLLVNKLIGDNLIIYYLSLTSLITSLYITTNVQIKKQIKFKSLRMDSELS
nr:phosphatase PAP2 family protein [Pedobacter sp. ASV28]